jgi:hypothetical protein
MCAGKSVRAAGAPASWTWMGRGTARRSPLGASWPPGYDLGGRAERPAALQRGEHDLKSYRRERATLAAVSSEPILGDASVSVPTRMREVCCMCGDGLRLDFRF